ncbi:transposase [Pseudomonas fragi]|uniref:Mu transposase C-terminal domain-containing protein n=1 Tax=Pseudomonas fragi TaxID=296 RepID=UPI001473679A|nr:Mu transposase C-terminal domain-containing protein [Pseudomonas fragi]NNB06628.1 transposase [Pseudomonas fragi]
MLKANIALSPADKGKHRQAMERWDVFRKFRNGYISSIDAMLAINLKKSMFYKLLRIARHSSNYKCLLQENKGPRAEARHLGAGAENLIEIMYHTHYHGSSATISAVWRHVQAGAKIRGFKCPSYHAVRMRINAKDEREKYQKKYGKEAADQKYSARPGRKTTTRPLEWVQIDHTLADVILVDSIDRSKIIGRPWLSLAICKHTRLILGFYTSLLAPSAVSVAMVIANSVSSKGPLLSSLGLSNSLLPRHGVMKTIHTDNAVEFVSYTLEAACESYDIELLHRRRKHYGGHIERLIGTMMTTKIHFLRGTTFSNVLKRRDYSPEKKATLAFEEFTKFLAVQVSIYNATTHSSLGQSPNQAWDCYFANNPDPVEIPQTEIHDFRIDFFPQEIKKVHPYGIDILGRRYYGPILKYMVGEKILIKYDPYDLGELYGLINDKYESIPISYDPKARSRSYELYRYQRRQRGVRSGTITEDEALVVMVEAESDLNLAEYKTLGAKARRKSEAARSHREIKRRTTIIPIAEEKELSAEQTSIPNDLNYVSTSLARIEEPEEIDFSASPTFYDGELK